MSGVSACSAPSSPLPQATSSSVTLGEPRRGEISDGMSTFALERRLNPIAGLPLGRLCEFRIPVVPGGSNSQVGPYRSSEEVQNHGGSMLHTGGGSYSGVRDRDNGDSGGPTRDSGSRGRPRRVA